MHLTFNVPQVVTIATVILFTILINHHSPTHLLTSSDQQQYQVCISMYVIDNTIKSLTQLSYTL